MFKILKTTWLMIAVSFPMVSQATPSLTLTNTFQLSSQLESAYSNFHPQGLGFDTSANELLFIQQGAQKIYRTDLTGTVLGFVNTGLNHNTSVAADASNYYFSDYTANANGLDLYKISKSTGTVSALSSEKAAYGGYPINVSNGLLYRTNVTTGYNNINLNQIRVSSITTPDTISKTLTLTGSAGIADFAIDTAHNSIWELDYKASSSIRRFDLNTGELLNTFALGLDGLDAGLAYNNNTLYYYNSVYGNSTLQTFSVDGIAPVPEAETYSMMLMGLGLMGFVARRRKNEEA